MSRPAWRSRLGAVAFTVVVASAALPLLHAYSSMSGVVTSPGGLDDTFCLSCHGSNRGHVGPPDRSCMSCHATDFDRHEQTSETELHLDRAGPGLALLAGSYAFFCLALLLFLLNPLSMPRAAMLAASLMGLAGVVAAVFEVAP